MTTRTRVENKLLELGIMPHLTAYSMLADAVETVIGSPPSAMSICRNVYLPIAQRHGISASRVSLIISKAIKIAYSTTAVEELMTQLGNITMLDKDSPTPSAFICAVALKVRQEMEQEE